MAKVENTHFAKEDHGYEYTKRQAMYPFMAKHLGLDTGGVLDTKTGKFEESPNTIEKVDTMRTIHTLAEIPKHALKPGAAVPMR